jgi:hypothetical protein
VTVGDDRLWQPLTDVAFPADARAAQLVDQQPVVTVATNPSGDAISSPAERDPDEAFDWMIRFINRGLSSNERQQPRKPRRSSITAHPQRASFIGAQPRISADIVRSATQAL